MTNKCKKCGNQCPSTYLYCPFCGQMVTQVNHSDNLLDLRNHFVIQGVSRDKQAKIMNEHIIYVLDKEDTFNINLKVTMPINESVIFDVCFQDVNGETIFNLKSLSCSLLTEENDIVKVPFTLPARILCGYNVAIIKYNNVELFRIDFIPSVISVKIDNSWFNMRLQFGYYNACITFLTWWMLMPNTTSKDVRYTNWYMKLDCVSGMSLQEKCSKVKEFILKLKSKTKANITLATSRRSPEWLDKHCGTMDFYFDESNEDTRIYIEMSINDYLSSIKSNSSTLVEAYSSRHGIIAKDGNPMSEYDMFKYINTMLKSRFDGWLY